MTAHDDAYADLLERTRTGVFRQNRGGELVDCNPSCARILGYQSREQMLQAGVIRYCNESDRQMVLAALDDLGSLSNLEISLRRRDGTPAWVLLNIAASDPVSGVIDGVMMDITDQRIAAERFEYQTQHDAATGLPNRTLFIDRLDVAIARARRQRSRLAVLYIDLDRFELVNTTFGRGVADRIILKTGEQLLETVRAEDSVARFGSDEFTLFLTEYDEEETAAFIAQRLLDAISEPIDLGGQKVYLTASAGIAIYPDDGQEADVLIHRAADAMFRAKERGRNTYQLYQPLLQARAVERLMLLDGMRQALERGEMEVHFQPQINLQTGSISMLEALLRWRHPRAGLLDSHQFLGAAEQTNLVGPIGDFVWREVCRQKREWDAAGIRTPRIAMNVAVSQLGDPLFPTRLQKVLDELHLDAADFDLEVKERALASDSTILPLAVFREMGYRIALDNFGTGRCSFADLKHLPVDTVKIDGTFVRNTSHSSDAALVDGMITMARGLGKRVVAQGVEMREQISFLRARNCHEMQGYFFGRPLGARQIEPMLH
ncbi:MAG TPA: EAL domain-containing protein [Thermoanaerobaculia bacterium]|nr:EAL domain-containing protein [Thermoanaerobaculia bacterium]